MFSILSTENCLIIEAFHIEELRKPHSVVTVSVEMNFTEI